MPTPDVGAVAHVRVLTRSRACCAICNVVKERVAPTSLESINRSLAHSRTHSVVDWCAFALWREGKLVRSTSVSPDGGVREDIGDKLPFEVPYWNGSRLRKTLRAMNLTHFRSIRLNSLKPHSWQCLDFNLRVIRTTGYVIQWKSR